MSENTTSESPTATSPTPEGSTATDLIMPFKILVSPLRAFRELAQKPTPKGLVTLIPLVLVIIAAMQYATATRIFLTINGQPTSFLATDGFANWFTGGLAATSLYIVMFWLLLLAGLGLIGRTLGGKDTSIRNTLVIITYLLSVFIVLYGVRTLMYFALPSIDFQTGSWPPVGEDAINGASDLISQIWEPNLVYQLGTYFTLIAFAWFAILGTMAMRAMREISWTRASIVSVVAFLLAAFLLGLP